MQRRRKSREENLGVVHQTCSGNIPRRWLYFYLVWVCQLAQSTLGCTRKMFRDRSQALWVDSMDRGRSDDRTLIPRAHR